MTNKLVAAIGTLLLLYVPALASNFEGVVNDFVTGKRAPRAVVRATTQTDITEEMSRANLEGVADAKGEFVFRGLLPGKTYVLLATAPGMASSRLEVRAPDKGKTRVLKEALKLAPQAPGPGFYLYSGGRALKMPSAHDLKLVFPPRNIPMTAIEPGEPFVTLQCAESQVESAGLWELKSAPDSGGRVALELGAVPKGRGEAIQTENSACGFHKMDRIYLDLGPGPSVGYLALKNAFTRETGVFRVAGGPKEFVAALRSGDFKMAAATLLGAAEQEDHWVKKLELYREAGELSDAFHQEIGDKMAALIPGLEGQERKVARDNLVMYWGAERVEKEFPPKYKPFHKGEYHFSLKAGERLLPGVEFPYGASGKYSLSSKDYGYKLVYEDGQEVKDGPNVKYPKKSNTRFTIVALTDQDDIKLLVK